MTPIRTFPKSIPICREPNETRDEWKTRKIKLKQLESALIPSGFKYIYFRFGRSDEDKAYQGQWYDFESPEYELSISSDLTKIMLSSEDVEINTAKSSIYLVLSGCYIKRDKLGELPLSVYMKVLKVQNQIDKIQEIINGLPTD